MRQVLAFWSKPHHGARGRGGRRELERSRAATEEGDCCAAEEARHQGVQRQVFRLSSSLRQPICTLRPQHPRLVLTSARIAQTSRKSPTISRTRLGKNSEQQSRRSTPSAPLRFPLRSCTRRVPPSVPAALRTGLPSPAFFLVQTVGSSCAPREGCSASRMTRGSCPKRPALFAWLCRHVSVSRANCQVVHDVASRIGIVLKSQAVEALCLHSMGAKLYTRLQQVWHPESTDLQLRKLRSTRSLAPGHYRDALLAYRVERGRFFM